MIEQSIQRLALLCETIPPLLHEIGDPEFSSKPSPRKWSKKETIGHLIDSATNNHHRFIRGQYEDIPYVNYDTDAWNSCGHYDQIDGGQIISFWTLYNKQLLAL